MQMTEWVHQFLCRLQSVYTLLGQGRSVLSGEKACFFLKVFAIVYLHLYYSRTLYKVDYYISIHKRHTWSPSLQALYSRLCIALFRFSFNGNLITPTVVSLSAVKFKFLYFLRQALPYHSHNIFWPVCCQHYFVTQSLHWIGWKPRATCELSWALENYKLWELYFLGFLQHISRWGQE